MTSDEFVIDTANLHPESEGGERGMVKRELNLFT